MSPHLHSHYFKSAGLNPLNILPSTGNNNNSANGPTAITTQGGNTVININIGST